MLAAIVSAAVAISVILRARRGLASTFFTIFAANLFALHMGAFLHNLTGAIVMRHVELVAAALLPVSAMLFFSRFLWNKPVLPGKYIRVAYVVSAMLVVILSFPWGYNSIVTAFMMLYVFGGLYLCAWFIRRRYQELDSKRERVRLRYVLIIHLAAVTFVLLGLLPGPLGFLRTWGNLVSAFFLYLVSQSLLKYRLLDLQELFGRALVLSGVALILAMVFGVLVILAGGAPEVSLFHTFVASMVILILFEPLRDQVESKTKRLFFRERFELIRKLEELRREVANILDLDRMSRTLLDAPYDAMRITHASLYLLEEGGASYRLVEHRGPAPVVRIDVAAHRNFFEELEKRPTAVLAETFERQVVQEVAPAESEPSRKIMFARSVLDTLNAMQAGICIPLVGQSDVLGLWNLHDEAGLESYSADEIALLVSIGEQAAINIENSRVFERIRERDRLAVLGQMAAGLAHEIRNPLGAIKGAAQYLDPESVGPDAAEFLNIIVEEVDRLNSVVDQFLNYARPYQTQHSCIDVNQIIKQTTKLVAPTLMENHIDLKLELAEEIPKIESNERQLRQVLLNLINNAKEAMELGGTLTIKTEVRKPTLGLWPKGKIFTTVNISISDTGKGIPLEKQENIFLPFFTTKQQGTGLGLAISQRIIKQHGGEIRVVSTPDEGTTFIIMFKVPTEQQSQQPKDKEPDQEKKAQENDTAPLKEVEEELAEEDEKPNQDDMAVD